MLPLDYCLLHFTSVLFITGVGCEELTLVKTQESSVEGSTFTLSYTYQKIVTANEYFFWYRQHPGEPPEFLISHIGTTPKQVSRLSATVSGENQLNLQVASAAVADSVLYYCAVRPNTGSGGYGKVIFGAGTSLTITTSEVYEPSYYLLDENDKKVCLATGFSQHDQHKNSTLFSSTTPARISGDSLFSQVAFNASDHNCMAAGGDGGSVSCEDKMKPDPTVNLVSVTVLGLRLIFLKTIVFNVFLTFRLWHSR